MSPPYPTSYGLNSITAVRNIRNSNSITAERKVLIELFLFNGISIIVSYLIPKPSLQKNNSDAF